MKELLFVYNADSKPIAQVKDLFTKILAPKKYSCNLCMVSYGTLRMKRDWKTFLEQLFYDVRFLHRDEFRDLYGDDSELPAAFTVENGELKPLITAGQMNSIRSVGQLIELLKQKLQPGTSADLYSFRENLITNS